MKPVSIADEQTDTLASGIANHLRTLIASGEIPPGEKLRLDELRAKFGVSLSPLREALSRLGAEGFVAVMENQRGYRVAPVSENNLVEVTRLRAEIEAFAQRESIARGDDRWDGEVVARLHQLTKLERSMPAGTRVEDWQRGPPRLPRAPAFGLPHAAAAQLLLHASRPERSLSAAFPGKPPHRP